MCRSPQVIHIVLILSLLQILVDQKNQGLLFGVSDKVPYLLISQATMS